MYDVADVRVDSACAEFPHHCAEVAAEGRCPRDIDGDALNASEHAHDLRTSIRLADHERVPLLRLRLQLWWIWRLRCSCSCGGGRGRSRSGCVLERDQRSRSLGAGRGWSGLRSRTDWLRLRLEYAKFEFEYAMFDLDVQSLLRAGATTGHGVLFDRCELVFGEVELRKGRALNATAQRCESSRTAKERQSWQRRNTLRKYGGKEGLLSVAGLTSSSIGAKRRFERKPRGRFSSVTFVTPSMSTIPLAPRDRSSASMTTRDGTPTNSDGSSEQRYFLD